MAELGAQNCGVDMATGLLDLSFLTEEERDKLRVVLKEDEDLRTRDRIRLGTLRQDYEQTRSKQLQFKDKRQCSCCEQPLGRLLNTGALCPSCGNRVCKLCRRSAHNPSQKFICTVCEKQWLFQVQEFQSAPACVAPPPSTSSSQQSTGTPPSKPSLYGSDLVRLSLLAPAHSSNPADGALGLGAAQDERRTTVSSIASSIVVKYVDRMDSSEPSSLSSSAQSSQVPSQARKLTPDELSSESSLDEEENPSNPQQLLPQSSSMESISSMMSMYSAEGGRGDYVISGKVELGVWHKEGTLFVRVVKANGLAVAKSGGVSDPYVKTYLLPDKSKRTKRKTGVQRKTTNPEYNEILKNRLSREDVGSRTLWVSVWDWDRFGRNQFLGEIRLPLASLNLTDSSNCWYTLQDQQDDGGSVYRGKLKLAIKFQPHGRAPVQGRKDTKVVGVLHVSIKEAEDLPKMDPLGLTDATVKLYLLPNRGSSSKKKTHIVNNSLCPVWNEDFEYRYLNLKELKTERVLEITVWDFDRRGSNDFIGGLRLGPSSKHKEWMDANDEEVGHWEEVLAHPGEWVERWHTLRSSMFSRWKLAERETKLTRNLNIMSPIGETTSGQQQSDVGGASAKHEPAHPVRPAYPLHESPPSPDSLSGVNDNGGAGKASEQRTAGITSPPRNFSPIPEVSTEEQDPFTLGAANTHGSMSSLHSASGVKGDYDITGDLSLKLTHKNNELLVYVDRAKGLAAADSNGLSDPYVKTYLLPDKSKHSKRKTEVRKKTLNPVYKETLKYEVQPSEFPSRTLWVSVWDWDRFGRNKFLGEISLPLSSIDFSDTDERWYQLLDKDSSVPVSTPGKGTHPLAASRRQVSHATASPQHFGKTSSHVMVPASRRHTDDQSYRGEIRLGLMFSPGGKAAGGTLHVAIKDAKALPNVDKDGKTDGFVKLYLLPEKNPKGKRKTTTIKNDLNPVWEEKFTYDKVSADDLSTARALEVTVWDYDRGSSNKFVGGLRIGPTPHHVRKRLEWMDSNQEEASHWTAILASPGQWVERLHSLRASMDPRDIDLSDLSSFLAAEGEEESKEEVGGIRIQAVPELKSEGVGTEGEEAGITLSAIARAAEGVGKEEEFRKVSVGDHTGNPPDSSRHGDGSPPTSEEPRIISVRKRPSNVPSPPSRRSPASEEAPLRRSSPVMNRGDSRNLVIADKVSAREPTEHSPVIPSTNGHLNTEPSSERETPPLSDTKGPAFILDPPHTTPSAPPTTSARMSPRPSATPPPTSPSPLLKQMRFHGSSSTLGSAVSFGSSASVYSAAGGKGKYEISGEVMLGITYVGSDAGGHLEVKVCRARYLAAGNKQGYSNSYVKTYLLPDKARSTKQKTSVKKKSLNPVYNEVLKYQVAKSELASRTLWVSVWDWDRFGRNQFLGEVRLPLTTLDLTDTKENWYTLQDKGVGGVDDFIRGDLRIRLMFKPHSTTSTDRGTLNIHIKEARDLPAMNANGLADAIVKCFLLPDRSSSSKKKTGVIKNNINPVWEEKFEYQQEVTLRELLEERVLEVTVWDHSKHGNDFIGGLHVGGAPGRAAHHRNWMDSIGTEVTHWEVMLSRPGEWVEEWHTLRPSMVSREVDLSITPPPFTMPAASGDILNRAHPSPEHAHPPQPVVSSSPAGQDSKAQSPVVPIPTIQLEMGVKPTPEPGSSPTPEPDSSIIKPTPEPSSTLIVKSAEESEPSKDTPSLEGNDDRQEPKSTAKESEPSRDTPSLEGNEDGQEPKSKYQGASLAKRSGLLSLGTTGSMTSFGSMTSIYSAAGGKGDYDITGDLLFGVYYKNGQLVVHIDRAKGLAAADSNGFSDPYVKTYLLPDKSKNTKKKTDIKKKTLNPVYNHTIKYKVSQQDVGSRTVWVSVWDWDRFGRNQFLGEVRLPLASLDLTDATDHWHSLQDQETTEEEGASYKGQLMIAMMFEEVTNKKGKSKGTLHVSIKQAKDLHNRNSSATTDSFVKCYLLPDKSTSGKRKTKVIRGNRNPAWEESFTYEKLQLSELSSERALEVAVWDFNKGTSSEFIGGLRLGPAPSHGKRKEWMDSIGEEVGHWESVMAHPGEWQEVWHTLRTTMDYRSVSLS